MFEGADQAVQVKLAFCLVKHVNLYRLSVNYTDHPTITTTTFSKYSKRIWRNFTDFILFFQIYRFFFQKIALNLF